LDAATLDAVRITDRQVGEILARLEQELALAHKKLRLGWADATCAVCGAEMAMKADVDLREQRMAREAAEADATGGGSVSGATVAAPTCTASMAGVAAASAAASASSRWRRRVRAAARCVGTRHAVAKNAIAVAARASSQ
jgi:hypothetical protein